MLTTIACFAAAVLARGTPSAPAQTAEPAPAHAKVVFASCANDKTHPELASFRSAAAWKPDAAAFLGDTPYIDSTDPAKLALRHKEFRDHPAVAALRAQCGIYSVWDDHDFGANDTDGNLQGKRASRDAFVAAHPEQSCGTDGEGVWTTFRRGDVEVWLLDGRWNANTGVDASGRPILLGEAQWRWLEDGLQASTATFKVLGCGMIWNDATRPGKQDYWGRWPHERERLFRFLGARRIGGVVLVSGDIHRTRMVRHATREVVGYELTELVTSPAAQSPIAAADAPDAGLVFDKAPGQTWLSVETKSAGTDTLLVADFRDERGVSYFQTRLWASHLKGEPRMPAGLVYESASFDGTDWPYAVHVPRGWHPGGPTLLFLHGRGECGSDGQLQLAVGLAPALLRAPSDWPFLVVFPQKPSPDEDWEHYERQVLSILERAQTKYGADPARTAITGLSQGGHGSWELARRNPLRFRAVAPLCGYAAAPAQGWAKFDRERDWDVAAHRAAATAIAEALHDHPIWTVHGDADTAVPIALTDVVVDALRAKGALPHVERLAGVGHDCWTRAYADPRLAAFLREATTPQLRR